MNFFRRAHRLPETLRAALDAEEQVLAAVPVEGGAVLAASRFGLWVYANDVPRRIDWHVISKARFTGGAVELTVADEVDHWASGTVILRDRAPIVFRPVRSSKVTDHVHDRVRRSVVASEHLRWPGAGGWIVLRRVAGRDGVITQVRLDAGADPQVPGFADAVAVADEVLRSVTSGGSSSG